MLEGAHQGQRHGHHEREQGGKPGEEQGDRQALQDQVHHRDLEDDGGAEVAAEKMLQEDAELHDDRLVEPEMSDRPGDVLVGRVNAAEPEGFGPFPVRNFQPIQLLILGMFGDRAAVIDALRIGARGAFHVEGGERCSGMGRLGCEKRERQRERGDAVRFGAARFRDAEDERLPILSRDPRARGMEAAARALDEREDGSHPRAVRSADGISV